MKQRLQTLAGAIVALAMTIMTAAPAWALQPQQQNEFVPIDKLPPSEQLPSAPLLVAAYAFVWIAVMFYLWTIWRRLGRVDADLQALERRTRSGQR
jgi:CcmD family protein